MKTANELRAAAMRAEMRHHALSWRAETVEPSFGLIEQSIETMKVNLDCAKSYRDMALDYERQAAREKSFATTSLDPGDAEFEKMIEKSDVPF